MKSFTAEVFISDLLIHISDYTRNVKKISRVRQQPRFLQSPWRKTNYLYINSIFIPYFGKYRLEDITPVMCEKFKKSRIDKGVQANSLNIELHYLKKLFKQAINWKDAETNPMNDVEFLKVIPKENKILTKEEEKLLFKALEKEAPWLSPLVLFGLNTGLRRKEMLELSWENVSIQNATAYIPAQSRKNKRPLTVYLNSTALKVIKEAQANNGNDLVFGFNGSTVEKAMDRACKSANLKDISMHTLRHTHASRLEENGYSEFATAALGHSSRQMTKQYVHFNEKFLREAQESLV